METARSSRYRQGCGWPATPTSTERPAIASRSPPGTDHPGQGNDASNSESLTSTATIAVAAKLVPLPASLINVPGSHDGSTWFTFDLAFSENVKAGYKQIRDVAFTINGGDIKKAQRKQKSSNQYWTMTVEPLGNGDINITLPETTSCTATGAHDGRKLSNSLSFTVFGPGNRAGIIHEACGRSFAAGNRNRYG